MGFICPKDGSLLEPREGKMVCPVCGYSEEEGKLVEKEKKKEVFVVEEGQAEVRPVVDAECEKCGNKKAYFWSMQTRSSDEPETRFYKCTKCGYVWREYS